MTMTDSRRYIKCFHFTPHGRQLGEGCPLGKDCNFSHPGDSTWDSAKTSHYNARGPPPSHHQGRKNSFVYHPRPPSRSRSRDNGWPRRQRPSSPSRSPHHRRRDSIASSVASDRGRDRRDSPASINPTRVTESVTTSRVPLTSIKPIPPPEIFPFQPPPPSSSPRSSHRPSLLDRIKTEEEPISLETPIVTTTTPKFSTKNWFKAATAPVLEPMIPTPPASSISTTSFSNMAHPAPPPAQSPVVGNALPPSSEAPPSASMGPPPVPPMAREASLAKSQEDAARRNEALWNDKIRQLSVLIDSMNELSNQEDELTSHRQLRNSSGFSNLDVTRQNAMNQKIHDLEQECEKMKRQYETRINELVKVEIWPSDMVVKERESIEEMTKIKTLLQTLRELATTFEEIAKTQKEGTVADNAMEVDEEALGAGPSSRPIKRRRTEEYGSSGEGTDEATLEKLLEKYEKLQGQYIDLENSLEGGERDAYAQYLEIVFQRIEDQVAPLQNATPSEEQLQRTKGQLDTVETSVIGLAHEVADLFLKNDERERQLHEAKQKLAASDFAMEDLLGRLGIVEAQRTADQKRIDNLQAAFNKCIVSPPPGPVPPLPTPEALAHILENSLLEVARSEVRPMLESMRNEVENMLRDQSNEMCSSVWSKLGSTLKLVEMLSQRIGVIQPSSEGAQ